MFVLNFEFGTGRGCVGEGKNEKRRFWRQSINFLALESNFHDSGLILLLSHSSSTLRSFSPASNSRRVEPVDKGERYSSKLILTSEISDFIEKE